MKRLIALAIPALLLAACAQKTAQPDSSTAAQATRQPEATRMASAAASPKNDMGTMMSEGDYKFKLAGISDKNREGWVTLTETGNRVKVNIELMDVKGAKASPTASASAAASASSSATVAMPAHIHLGSCPEPGEVKYPLTNVVNNKSETTLPAGVTVKSLMDLGKLAVNVHKSATDLKTYVACGNLDFTTGMMKKEATDSAKAKPSTPASSVKASVKPTATPAASAQ